MRKFLSLIILALCIATPALAQFEGGFGGRGKGVQGVKNRWAVTVAHSGSQNVLNVTGYELQANFVRSDPSGMWRSDLPSRITFPVTGTYALWGGCYWQSNSSGQRILTYRVNGVTYLNVTVNNTPITGDTTRQYTFGQYHFNAGDYVELEGYQTSGSTLAITLVELSAALVARK